ncbi:MAG: helix-turn-helix domain-containing protein [Pseudonocardiaceae bacterium]
MATRRGGGLVTRGTRPVLGPAHQRLGERLRALRKSAKCTMRDLGRLVSKAHLSELENGQVTPSAALLGRLVGYLGGDHAAFARLLVAVRAENEERKRAGARKSREPYIAGLASPRAVTASFVLHGQPEISVVDQDGVSRVVEVDMALSADDTDFSPPVVVEDSEDDYTVGADRIIGTSIFSRTIRATEADMKIYRWWFTELPAELVVRTITLGVSLGGNISRVWQLGSTSYGVEIALTKALAEGEASRLRYYKVVQAVGYCSRWVRRVHAVELASSRLAVRFEGVEPEVVWYWSGLPPSSTPGFYSQERELKRQPTGQYEQWFGSSARGMSLGIAWRFPGDEPWKEGSMWE